MRESTITPVQRVQNAVQPQDWHAPQELHWMATCTIPNHLRSMHLIHSSLILSYLSDTIAPTAPFIDHHFGLSSRSVTDATQIWPSSITSRQRKGFLAKGKTEKPGCGRDEIRKKGKWERKKKKKKGKMRKAVTRNACINTTDAILPVVHVICNFDVYLSHDLLSIYLNVTTLRSGICYSKSVCCLSVCRLSIVCNVRAPYSGNWSFWQHFFATVYPSHIWTSVQNCTEIVPGEPLRRGR